MPTKLNDEKLMKSLNLDMGNDKHSKLPNKYLSGHIDDDEVIPEEEYSF
jgi:hypothetical protein